ncbi:FxsA family protein [Rhodobacteraceae bacterium RKSG542]|nr:FxsA family protein [Pseudovibrio flavus]
MPIGLILLAAFILLPTIEIYLFIEVGSEIGAIPTILLTVATAAAGSLMLRHQGLSLLMRMRSEMDAGRVPGDELMQGALIVVAAIMLLIPGFFTDAIGLLLFIPPVRAAVGRFLAARVDMRTVNIKTSQSYKRDSGVVDLDEGEWSSSEDRDGRRNGPSNGQDRISPWRDDKTD